MPRRKDKELAGVIQRLQFRIGNVFRKDNFILMHAKGFNTLE